jgi:hypothetical protein
MRQDKQLGTVKSNDGGIELLDESQFDFSEDLESEVQKHLQEKRQKWKRA